MFAPALALVLALPAAAAAPAPDPLAPIAEALAGEGLRDAVAAPPSSRTLFETLRSPDPEARAEAAMGLGRASPEGAATALSRALAMDPSWLVRRAAAAALGRARRPFSVRALAECLKKEPRWEVRLQAAHALRELGTLEAAGAAAAALSDRDSGVRAAATAALAAIGSQPHEPALRRALLRETDPSARELMERALRKLAPRR